MHGAYDGSVYMHNTLRRFLILSFPDAMEPSDPSKPRNHETPHAPSKRCSMELTRTRRLLGAAGVCLRDGEAQAVANQGFFSGNTQNLKPKHIRKVLNSFRLPEHADETRWDNQNGAGLTGKGARSDGEGERPG